MFGSGLVVSIHQNQTSKPEPRTNSICVELGLVLITFGFSYAWVQTQIYSWKNILGISFLSTDYTVCIVNTSEGVKCDRAATYFWANDRRIDLNMFIAAW